MLCYFYWCMFCNVHIIGPINVCTNFEINRYNIDEFRKHAKIVWFIWRHVTQKRYVVRHSISIRNILQSTKSLHDFRFKCHDPRCFFVVNDDLDLDRWHIFYFLSHKVRMKYWSLLAKFHKNMSSFDNKIVYIKFPRLDSSDLLIAQLVECQSNIHEVVGSSPTRRSTFSNLNLYNSPRARTYGVPPFPPKQNTQPVPR